MSLFTWLRSRSSKRAPQRQRRPAAPRFWPHLESLEDRDVPSTLSVTSNLDSGPGSLRAEIAVAHAGDTVIFDPSLNGQTIALTSGELVINKSLTIQGPGAVELTISGNLRSRVFEVDAAKTNASKTNVTLSGLTISNGVGIADPDSFNQLNGLGGGIYNAANLILSACTLSGNGFGSLLFGRTDPFGGGIYNAGALSVTNSILSGNGGAGSGGAIANFGSMSISGSILSDNSVFNYATFGSQFLVGGGGIYNAGKATITGSTLANNSTDFTGGGIDNEGTLTITKTTVSANFVRSGGLGGGGIFNGPTAHLTIQSSVVKNNTAPLGADLYNVGVAKISSDSNVGVIFG